jgi:anti-sigma regulatory factor (Ser/Thr protein kinase)/ActR/RegA family two-component response regulator
MIRLTMQRILFVGNDADLLKTVRGLQELPDFEVEVAAGDVDAVRRVRRGRFELVITSPGSSIDEDLALIAELREVRPGLREIILAPSATPADVIAVLRANVFACFTAPFDWPEIASLVRASLEERDWRHGIELLSATPAWISLRVSSQLPTAERLVQFMRELAGDQPAEEREDLVSAFREMLLNAMEHGAGFDPEKVIEVSAVRTDRAIVYHFRDPGEGFRQKELPGATPSSAIRDVAATAAFREAAGLRPGGFGMLIVRNLVDEVIYNESGNQAILVKHTR